MVGTLHHRAKTIWSSPQLLQQEEDHLYTVLTRWKYPTWAINRVKIKMKTPAQKKSTKNNANNQKNHQRPYIVVPYLSGAEWKPKENMQQVWGTSPFQWRCYHQKPPGGPTRTNILCWKSGVIYMYKCDGWTIMKTYIGESSRTFGERFKEHQKAHPHIWPL